MKRYENRSIIDLFKTSVSLYGSHRAVVFEDRATDFTTFDHLSDSIALFLLKKGIRKGDHVALYCINLDAFALAYMGIIKAGATVVPINVLLSTQEIEYILNDAQAVTHIRDSLKELTCFVSIGTKKSHESDSIWTEALSCRGKLPHIFFDPAQDVVSILYTSGTTGHPKGAMLTHRNLAANTWSIQKMFNIVPGEDVILLVLPMFHAFASTVGMLTPLLYGCTFIPQPKFEPEKIVQTIEKEKVTIFPGVPSMFSVLLRLPDSVRKRMLSLKYAVSGGAAMPPGVMKLFEEKFGILIYEGDGPTECSPVTCVNPIGGLRKIGSVGKPVPLVEMKVFNDTGRELPCGDIGEICVKGPNVMKGYWMRNEETRQSFFGNWFRTGDLGYEDNEGYFYIVDRKKDIIIVNGMNVYPRIIEDVLYKFTPIIEAAVVGEPHKLHGEIPVAYVVLHKDHTITSGDVRSFCRNYLGKHEIPRKVFFVKSLPKNAAGKILKRQLRISGEIERGIDNRKEE
jgi:long-chain acyl-CoA synthetase